jgi:hypothetical protein
LGTFLSGDAPFEVSGPEEGGSGGVYFLKRTHSQPAGGSVALGNGVCPPQSPNLLG